MLRGTLGMIIKMSLITLSYVAVTFLMWKSFRDRNLNTLEKIGLGLTYGILSVFSTHIGVDYGHMILNVRDLGPMAAGLFFDPLAGVIAGFVGGIERYIAGTYFNVGAYTRIACSVSTCFAGFFALFLNKCIFKGRKPSLAYAFSMGAVIEVFHMYVVFLTHRSDMRMAYQVVRTCSVPMIIFSGLGLMLCSLAIQASLGEVKSPFESVPAKEMPVSRKFQKWLFGVTAAVMLISFGFSYVMHSASALQDARIDLTAASRDIGNSITWIRQRGGHTERYSHSVGWEGTFLVLDENGDLVAGTQYDKYFGKDAADQIKTREPGEFFFANIFGSDSLCLITETDDGLKIFTQMPLDEVYESRDIQAYETMLADILFFTVIFVLISLLVQNMVVDNLLCVNKSLNKITEGDLEEKVDVYASAEFASLSDDINQTVDVLKGYISAAENRIEQELQLAHNIQEAALPKNFTFNHKGFEIYASMDPAKQVGGDFYDFFFVEQDMMAMVIADVSGKGIPAALFMMRSKSAIRGLAESGYGLKEIFERVNNELCGGNDLNMFVTVWMGIVNLRTGDMQCLNAGHEYPAVMRRTGDYKLYKEKHHPPLGVMENTKYATYELHLDSGDCLYVFTDGIPEAINIREEQYGTDRMINALNNNKELSVKELLEAVKADQDEFVGEADQFDDITMLGFRYKGQQ